jgi:hypothetical protein
MESPNKINNSNEIKEEINSFTTNGGHKEEEEKLLTPLTKSLKICRKIISAALKTPTEEALAFIEKAKIQIKKQNSLINQNESTTTPNESSPQHHKQLNKTTHDNNNNLLININININITELSLDDQPFEDEEQEEEEEEQIQQASLQLINDSSDQSTQFIDVDRYRFTTDDDITTTTTYNTPIIEKNGGGDESLLKEKEKNYIEYLQEENAKFK